MKKIMKKAAAFLLAAAMLACLSACGGKQGAETLEDLFDGGYERVSAGVIRGKIRALYTNRENGDSYVFSAWTSADEERAFEEADIYGPDGEETFRSMLLYFKNGTLENVTDRVPAADSLKEYAGKTVADLKAAGFEDVSALFSESKVSFRFSNKVYEFDAEADPATGSEEARETYVITKVGSASVSPDIIDEPLNEAEMLARVSEIKSVKPFYDNMFSSATSEPDGSGTYEIRFSDASQTGIEYIAVCKFTEEDMAEYQKLAELRETDLGAYFEERRSFFCGLEVIEIKTKE